MHTFTVIMFVVWTLVVGVTGLAVVVEDSARPPRQIMGGVLMLAALIALAMAMSHWR